MRLLVVERLLVRTRLVVANNEVFLLQYIVRQVLLQSLAVSNMVGSFSFFQNILST